MVESVPDDIADLSDQQTTDQHLLIQNARFRPSQRLLTGAAFSFVFKNARRSGDDWFTILVRPSADAEQPARLGLAIAKKELKFAKDRNRIKRLVRETFRLQQADLRGWEVVVMTRRPVQAVANEQLIQRLDKHWRKIASWPRVEAPPRPKRSAGGNRRRTTSKK